MKYKGVLALGLSLALTGCLEQTLPKKVASIGQSGSIGGHYGVSKMLVGDINGGGADFGYGAVSGCCASSTIAIGVPSSISGEWRSGWPEGYEKNKEHWRKQWVESWGEFPEKATWYRLDDEVDSELAKKKILTMNRYYKNHSGNSVMRVLVNEDEVTLLYSLSCTPELNDDCTVREDADPNGWVTTSPHSKHKGATAVILYKGKGESSDKPFNTN
ncbi:hypothetical protein [Vibrio owensii]|uniref:hypothetical protein n=1 Tax=Vibrio owensii TaxID=696485 RepID=UPI0018F15477|nr:hypothetical protein [Vibrio owensii]